MDGSELKSKDPKGTMLTTSVIVDFVIFLTFPTVIDIVCYVSSDLRPESDVLKIWVKICLIKFVSFNQRFYTKFIIDYVDCLPHKTRCYGRFKFLSSVPFFSQVTVFFLHW